MIGAWALAAAVLGASVLGSLHCVGMCGGFVAAVSGSGSGSGAGSASACASGPGSAREAGSLAPMFAYHGARGLAYMSLGALAGGLGAGLDASAAWVGVQRLAGPLMGGTLVVIALMSLWSSRAAARDSTPLVGLSGRASRRSRIGSRVHALRSALTRVIAERGAWGGAAAGLLSALLPCGWLWGYVVVAASTGAVGHGVMVMAAFWLGSVPALLGVGLLAGEFSRRVGRHAPRITAVLMLALGLVSLSGKVRLVPSPVEQPAVDQVEPCH